MRIRAECIRDQEKLKEINPTLAALERGHERLRLAQLGGEFILGEARRRSRVCQTLAYALVLVRLNPHCLRTPDLQGREFCRPENPISKNPICALGFR